MEKDSRPEFFAPWPPHDGIWLKNRIKSKILGKQFVQDHQFPYPVFRGYDVKVGMSEIIDTFKPDIVVVQAGNPFELVNWCSTRKIPVIYYARDVEFQRNSENLQINHYLSVVANSEFTKKRLAEELNVDALTLPPFVEPSSYIVSTKRKSVLHVGLVKEKGIEISFELAARRPDIDFNFVESWPIGKEEFSEFQLRARKLGNVKITGRVSNMKIIYGTAKIVLTPSIVDEAWGRVVTEAQFSGIPVIASNRGGLPESVGPGGIIVKDIENLREWESGLALLWDDEDKYQKISNAAKVWSQRPEIKKEHIVNQFIDYIETHAEKFA